jgi:hypothetical protein
MGASKTKSTTNISELNSTDIGMNQETFNKVKNVCEAKSDQKNVVNIVGSNVTKLTTSQKNAAKNTCILQTAIATEKDASAKNELLSNISNKLQQSASAGIGLANAESDTNIKKENLFKFKADQKTVNDVVAGCISQIDQENVINIVGSNVTDSKLEQANDVVMDCVSSFGIVDKMAGGAENKTTSTTENVQEQSAKGMDPLAFLGGMASLWSALPFILICCVILSSVSSVMGMGASGGMPSMPPMSIQTPNMSMQYGGPSVGLSLSQYGAPGVPMSGGSTSYYSSSY